MQAPKFEFRRSRGIVWVSDVEGSSSALNSDEDVAATELFLPRLHWLAMVTVRAAGGVFVKWTGDGFLAWFETTLERDLDATASRVFYAAQTLALLSGHLGVVRRFAIRHGITYEPDALVMHIAHDGHTTMDLLGRSVVLAFRCSSIAKHYPRIVTERRLVDAHRRAPRGKMPDSLAFRKLVVSKKAVDRYFKGEVRGTGNLFIADFASPHRKSHQQQVSHAEASEFIRNVRQKPATDAALSIGETILRAIADALRTGEPWAQAALADYLNWSKQAFDLLAAITERKPSETAPMGPPRRRT